MMETVADERQYDEFVKKLMIIVSNHFEKCELIQEDETKKLIAIQHYGLGALIDTESRVVSVKETGEEKDR